MSGGLAWHIEWREGKRPDPMAVKRALVRWADVVGPMMRELARAEAPVGSGPGAGRLRQQLRYERRTTGAEVQVKVVGGAPYTGFVIHGTSPHVIVPRNAMALRFQSHGQTVFATLVHHPGTKPNPFGQRALRRGMIAAQRTLAATLKESLEL